MTPHTRTAPEPRTALTVAAMLAVLGGSHAPASAQTSPETGTPDTPDAPNRDASNVVTYEAGFFETYDPVTALHMVQRVPGFRLLAGGDVRGFAGAAGNVLINGERPTLKDDTVVDRLDRIPARNVARIELIRGQTGEYDLRGQSVITNVVLAEDTGPEVQWDVNLEKDLDRGNPEPEGSVSLSDQWGATRYTASLQGGRSVFANPQTERLFKNGEVAEDRFLDRIGKGHGVTANLNTETQLSETVLRFNGEVSYKTDSFQKSAREVPRAEGSNERTVVDSEGADTMSFELGGDVQTPLSEAFSLKAIALFSYSDADSFSSQEIRDASGRQVSLEFADSATAQSESIARLEFDWREFDDHTLKLNLEGAYNTLDNALELTRDTGNGPQPVPVPGANTRVEELRGDFALSDSWALGDFALDSELAVETSTIKQSGEVGAERSFFFLKPNLKVTYAPGSSQQTRLAFRRDVAQLDFNDFVSSTNFFDDDLDLGNPDLKPDNTWILELSHERRFGDIGAVELTGFFHWINDVQDLVPVVVDDRLFEVPGNLGDGKRYGLEFEATLPLAPIGLDGARLDLDGRWQHSEVRDPVTGRLRSLSGERDYEAEIAFRQDFDRARLAWGWSLALQDERSFFGADERDIHDAGPNLNAFIETTRWFGLKLRAKLENILNRDFRRDRRVFERRRALSPRAFREFRDGPRGRSLTLEISGSF